ncbi:MAG: hypothetical protein RL653_1188 [Pseudomonadota bacterium]|jgi:hypothetical protein
MTMTVRLAALLSAAALVSGCNSFVTPRVTCPDVVLAAEYSLTAERENVPCSFPEVVDFTITRAPTIDPVWAAANGNPSANDLVGAQVTINRGTAAASLCDGVDCDPANPTITTAIQSTGGMNYRVRLNLDALGSIVGPGGTNTSTGIAATEVYGPGNACNVTFRIVTSCAQPIVQPGAQ